MGRAPCCEKVGLKRGRWTTEEDELLTKYIQDNGEGAWRSLPKNAGLLRCGKSCRLRWINYLKAGLKRGNISTEEEDLIVKLHISFGNRWSLIASHLPGRTDNEIKNYWNSHLSRKIYSFRRATIVDTTLPGLTNTPKVPINPPKPKSRRGGRTSRWAMKKNKIYTQKGNQKPKLQNAPQHINEEVASVPPPSTPSLESEVNLSCSTIEDFMMLDLDNNHNNNMVEKEEEEPISSNNENTNENEKEKELNSEVQNFPIYEKETNNDMLVLGSCNDQVEDVINVDDGLLGFDDIMGTLMLEASGVLTSSQESETNNNNNSVVALISEELGENNSVNDCWDLGNLDNCWDWESGLLKLNNNDGSVIDDELEGCNNNWEQRENLLAWLWEDDDLESECMLKLGEMDSEKQNDDMLAWFLS